MRTIIITIIAVLMASCTDMSTPKPEINKNPVNAEVVVIDSCEYVVWENDHFSSSICHKGNCKFCKQKDNGKEL